ncbi:MAG: EscU/YscU/HrcU family type III secretion system export apparatus switch protein, partial [Syntrophaceae bacterium]
MKDREQKAVALTYERGKDKAPRVTAKGRGALAEKILALAR